MWSQVESAVDFLKAAQTPSGGWPYTTGQQSSPEPTCYAILTLSGTHLADSAAHGQRGVQWLRDQIDDKGALAIHDQKLPHWSTSLALLTLTRLAADRDLVARCADFLLTWKVRTAKPTDIIRMDSTLEGWSWYLNTFSWIEPTCHALIALKAAGFGSHPRVAEGEALLLDRVCLDGGWNYGNASVYGRELYGFPDTTALALLALQGAASADQVVARGIDFLQRAAPQAPSALTFAWATITLSAYGVPVQPYVDALRQRQLPDGSWRQTIHLTALSALALQIAEGVPNAFKL